MSFTLRPYQNEAVDAVMADLPHYDKLGIIEPTGSGKTVQFIEIANRYLNENRNNSVLVMSHLSLLTTQTKRAFRVMAPHLRVGILQAKTRPSTMDNVIISTMQSSRIEDKIEQFKRFSIKKVGLIIVDECHHILTASYDTALGYFPDAKVIGCTATPFRSGRLMTNYFDKVSFSISLERLISEGYLVPPRVIAMTYDENSDIERMAMVARLYKDREWGKKAIIFMQTKDQAKAMRNVLVSIGVEARAVTDELTGKARDETFKEFDSGPLQVLTTVNVLTAGFDAPSVEAIFMPYATKSPATYMQRIGRGLRLCPRIDKSECRIYVFGDAPSVERKYFEKLTDICLRGDDKDPLAVDTVFDELDWLDESVDPQTYRWTMDICDAVKRMEALGMKDMANKLSTKNFPPKFLKDISRFASHLKPPSGGSIHGITKQQSDHLCRQGFKLEHIQDLNKMEASQLIAAATSYFLDGHSDTEFILTAGLHRGKHVKDVPYMYFRSLSPTSEPVRKWRKYQAKKKM